MPSMNRDVRIRSAVRRLLSGRSSQHDLAMLCLWLRYPRTAKGTIPCEIGDFVAHSEEREKGLTFQAASDFYWTWDTAQRTGFKHPFDLRMDRDAFKLRTDAIKRRIQLTGVQENLGLNPEAARQRYDAIAKLAQFDVGVGVYFDPPLTEKDQRLFDFLSGLIISVPAFNSQDLFETYRDAMIQNGVLRQDEIENWRSVVPFFSAYLIASMHRTKFTMSNGIEAFLDLVIGANRAGDKLQMQACFRINEDDWLCTPLFSSDLVSSQWCSPEMMLYQVEKIIDGGAVPWRERREFIPAVELSEDNLIVLSSDDVDAVLARQP